MVLLSDLHTVDCTLQYTPFCLISTSAAAHVAKKLELKNKLVNFLNAQVFFPVFFKNLLLGGTRQ